MWTPTSHATRTSSLSSCGFFCYSTTRSVSFDPRGHLLLLHHHHFRRQVCLRRCSPHPQATRRQVHYENSPHNYEPSIHVKIFLLLLLLKGGLLKTTLHTTTRTRMKMTPRNPRNALQQTQTLPASRPKPPTRPRTQAETPQPAWRRGAECSGAAAEKVWRNAIRIRGLVSPSSHDSFLRGFPCRQACMYGVTRVVVYIVLYIDLTDFTIFYFAFMRFEISVGV